MSEKFNANAARSLAANSEKKTTVPADVLAHIKRAAKDGKHEAWCSDLSSVTIEGLRNLGFKVESSWDRGETANKITW